MKEWISKSADPFEVFKQWYESAQTAGNFEPTSMTIATLDDEGMPSARVVLLKDFGEEGFRFFTNYLSRKGQELQEHPQAALVFHWQNPKHRQIRIKGLIEKLSYEDSDAYFQTRPRGSQIGAWASPQSREIQGRGDLEKSIQQIEEKFGDGPIPCPEFWGGYLLKPMSIEFWQAQEFRLHDRIRFRRSTATTPWTAQYLAP